MAEVPCIYWRSGDFWQSVNQTVYRKYWRPDTSDWGPDEVFYQCIAEYPTTNYSLSKPMRVNSTTMNWEFASDADGVILDTYARTGTPTVFNTVGAWADRTREDPVLYGIDGTNFSSGDQSVAGLGPVSFGGALYALQLRATSPVTHSVYKSTDGGQTWTEQDASNGKSISGVSYGYTAWDQASGIIRYARVSGATIIIQSFDCSTDTWQADSATFTASAAIFGQPRLHFRSNGDTVCVFQINGTFPQLPTCYAIMSGGTWGSQVQVSTVAYGTAEGFYISLVDANDAIHVFYNARDGSSLMRQFYRRLSSSNTLSTELDMDPIGGWITTGLIYDGKIWMFSQIMGSPNFYGITLWQSSDLTPSSFTTSNAVPYFPVHPSVCLSEPQCPDAAPASPPNTGYFL